MPFRNVSQNVIVNSGSLVSSVFDLRGIDKASLVAPTSVGVNTFLQTSFDTTSANFGRLQIQAPNSGEWMVTSPPADAPWAVEMTKVAEFPYGRIELGAAATDTRTFVLVGKEGL